MKKLLLALLIFNTISGSIFAKMMFVQDTSVNVWTLATTGQASGLDLTDLNSSQLASGAAITVQGSHTNLPTRTSALAITNLSGATLIGATFNCDQDGVILVSTNFSSANLQNATFNGCNLTGANFQNATLTGVTFTGNSILNNADFSGTATNLSGASLSNIQAVGANFTNVPMYGANLSCSNFSSARFSGAGLSGTTLSCANPVVCAGVNQVTYANANCTGGTNFTGALFYDPATGNGLEQSIRQEYITKNSSGQYVISTSTTQLNLQGITLSNVIFSNANMVGIDLSQTTCNSCYFFGNNTNLTSADFTNANLTGTNFASANLTNANFTNANLTCANLMFTNLTGVVSPLQGNGYNVNGSNISSDLLNYALQNGNIAIVGLAEGQEGISAWVTFKKYVNSHNQQYFIFNCACPKTGNGVPWAIWTEQILMAANPDMISSTGPLWWANPPSTFNFQKAQSRLCSLG